MREYFKFNKYTAIVVCGDASACFYGSSLRQLRADMFTYIRASVPAGGHASWYIYGGRFIQHGFANKSLCGRFYFTRLS